VASGDVVYNSIMASDDEKLLRLLGKTKRFWDDVEGPGQKALRESIKASEKLLALADLPPSIKRMLNVADAPSRAAEAQLRALDHATGRSVTDALNARLEQQKAEQERSIVETVAAVHAHRERQDATIQRQHVFVMLVQTRALFHDCQQVMKLRGGGKYSALAPGLVQAALQVPLEEIDEDVGLHAEAFIRVAIQEVSGADTQTPS
jgi:hypothetical protein